MDFDSYFWEKEKFEMCQHKILEYLKIHLYLTKSMKK